MPIDFLKLAFRNLLRNKGFSAINIFGLAIGMASAIIILLWIQNEVSYDRFHENKDRIYEAWNRVSFSGKILTWNATPKVLARTLKKDFPEVEQATRVNWPNDYVFTIGARELFVQGNRVDSNFLQVFSFPLIEGNAATVLRDPTSIVLTKKLAVNLFGKEESVGKTIKINGQGTYTVTGVLKDLPNNTSFDFEYLLPWDYSPAGGNDQTSWTQNNTHTYVLLRPDASLSSIAPMVKVLRQQYDDDAKKSDWQYFLYPISRWRLYSDFENGRESGGGRITLVRLFSIIAAFILLIACINFMNLSTARSEKRAKEVGIRKVIGARKASLVSQFLGESVLLALMAGLIAIVIVQLCLNPFNQLTGKNLYVPFGSAWFWLYAGCFILFTGLLAGSYPAFFLASFRPVKTLKGAFKKANALVTPRKVLVVLQFTFAIVLIICTIVVKEQIDYAKDRQPGYDKSNLIYSYFSDRIKKNYLLLKNDLLSSGTAVSITATSAPLTRDWNNSYGQEWEGKDPDDQTSFSEYIEDGGLGKTAGLTFSAGRDIDVEKYPTDSLGIILNETALKVMRFRNPLGQIIRADGQQWHVVGIIRDFILTSPYEPVKPMLIFGPKFGTTIVEIKLNDKNPLARNLAATAAVFKKYDPEYLFRNNFTDQEYAANFEDEERTGTLAALFASLTILISCLGLFGLATYMAETRIKEIGIRRILGGSVAGISALLSKDFIKLVTLSTIIASPIAWFAMHRWLGNYSYRINISWPTFAAAGLLAILIAVFTVGFQAIRAATANPINSLRRDR
jgi:ABC-type antimicrobial peptide transport system permease subunit